MCTKVHSFLGEDDLSVGLYCSGNNRDVTTGYFSCSDRGECNACSNITLFHVRNKHLIPLVVDSLQNGCKKLLLLVAWFFFFFCLMFLYSYLFLIILYVKRNTICNCACQDSTIHVSNVFAY